MEEKVSLARALEIIDMEVSPLAIEPVELMLAGGHVLAEDISAWVDLPGADVSIKDGYAMRSRDISAATADAPAVLKTAGKSSFIAPFEETLGPGECVRVYSGVVIPEGADTVVPDEELTAGDDSISVPAPAPEGQLIRRRAEEFTKGEMMAPAGTVLTPGWISLLIAAGWMEVNTVRPPRIRILAVGDELKNPGRALEPGDVFPSAAAGIFAWCRKESATEVRLSLVGDDYYDLQEEMPDSSVADLVITLGGTGRSERDVVINAIDELGADVLFRGVQVKPGHYAAFAKLDDMPVVCLPGGPSAAEMMFHVLARRAIHARMGDPGWSFIINYALLEKDIPPRQELDQLVRVAIDYTAEGIVASPLSDLKAHREIAETSGIVLSRAGKELKAGEKVEVWLI